MVRSLWTAATGMIAQQNNVDNIANNLANVNTTGYKTQTIEFKSLLYQSLQARTTSSDGTPNPVGAQVGLGVRNASINTIFTDGSMTATESDTAFAITGKGFFAVKGEDGKPYYTRNGTFQWTTANNGGTMLADSDGRPVLDTKGQPIILDSSYVTSRITVTADGQICYPDEQNNPQPIGVDMGLFQFSNPSGLEKLGDSLYQETPASGGAINEATSTAVKRSAVHQNFLEASNVQVVDEMVSMIVAQRAYEMNSKAITASDTMMQQANNLRG